MTQGGQGRFVVPPIYSDHSSQGEGYFQFQFRCPECDYEVMTNTQRSSVATKTRIMDLGVGLIGGFWGRAAEQGEQMFGAQWEKEKDQALVKAWGEIQKDFRYCGKCKRTVCFRCWNPQINMCNNCAPDLKSDAVAYQHELTMEAQRQQIQQNYHAPQFNTGAVASAVTPDMVMPQPGRPAPQGQMPPAAPQAPSAASIAGFSTPGYPQQVNCPSCSQPGIPGKFCQNCGTRLPLPDLFCPKCSAQVAANSHFCPECGERLMQ